MTFLSLVVFQLGGGPPEPPGYAYAGGRKIFLGDPGLVKVYVVE